MSQALRTASNGAPGTFHLHPPHPPTHHPPNALPLSPPAWTALGLSECLSAPGVLLLCESTVHMCELQNSPTQRDAQSRPLIKVVIRTGGVFYGPDMRALGSASEMQQKITALEFNKKKV